MLREVEGDEAAAFGSDVERSVVFGGGAEDAKRFVEENVGVVEIETVSVGVVVADAAGIGSYPNGLHAVEEDAVDGVMAQRALRTVLISLDAVGDGVEDVQSVESAYPYFAGGRLGDAADTVVGQSVAGVVAHHFFFRALLNHEYAVSEVAQPDVPFPVDVYVSDSVGGDGEYLVVGAIGADD